MSLNLTLAEVVPGSGTPISGYSWPVAAFPYEEIIAATYPENMVSWAQPARIKSADVPVTDTDACNLSRKWTAQTAQVSRAQSDAVLGSLPRWVLAGPGVAGTNGLFGTMDAAVTSYTYAGLVKSTAIAASQTLFNINNPSASPGNTTIYVSGTGALVLVHGGTTAGIAAKTLSANTWHAVLISYDAGDEEAMVYLDTVESPEVVSSHPAGPGGTGGAIGVARNGTWDFTGEIALSLLWDTALHKDASAIRNVMDGLNGLRGL